MVLENNMWIVTHRKLFYALSVILIGISLGSLIVPGIRFGIDFTGGSLMQIAFTERPSVETFTAAVQTITGTNQLPNMTVQPAGENAFTLRTETISEDQKNDFVGAIQTTFSDRQPTLERFTAIGPTVGNELRQKAYLAVIVVIIAIVVFITFAFREVSKPVASWKYGAATVVALLHDVLIPLGAYVIFSAFFGGEIDMLFISALLAILGFSVHDTIVVFDRIRENLKINTLDNTKESFESVVGRSIEQTFTRSINTSVTTLIVLLALFIFGSDVIKNFTFALIAGIIVGTYSSIFIASPLMVTLFKMQKVENGEASQTT